MKQISISIAMSLLVATATTSQAEDLTADQIVDKANQASYYAGEDGRADVTMTITDSGGVVQDQADGGHSVRLARAEGIAGSLSGSVSVSEDPGQVTRVEVALPCGAEAARQTEEGFPPMVQLQASDIWVVDDDAIFRQMCRQTLESEGHQVDEMESA